MRGDMRSYWRDPRYWRWLWQSRVSGQTKGAIGVTVAVAFGIAGYLSAGRVAATEEAATFTTQRVVTVVRTTRANAPPEAVTKSQTVIQPGETDLVTVRRDGRTVVRRAPGETVTTARTVRGPVEQRVVTNARTDTVVLTETTDRPTTVTTPATTETVTREVTQPARTVTETGTVTETNPPDVVTVTEEVTVTEVVTVTVPGKKPG
jgi:hypothetical protein